MTDPRHEEDVQIPLRVQPVVARPEGWRGRSVSFIAIGLVAFVAVGVLLGTANIGGPQRLPPIVFATEEPTAPPATPRPSQRPIIRPNPTSPPLPEHLVLGDELPTERRLVFANGLQALDMASGELGATFFGYDSVLTLGGDQFVCACPIRDGGAGSLVRGLKFERLTFDGQMIAENELATWDDLEAVAEMGEGWSTQLAIAPERKRLFVLASVRRPPSWTVDLLSVDLIRGELLSSRRIVDLPVALDEEPQPSPSRPTGQPGSPPDGRYVWAQGLAVTPDGTTAMVSLNDAEVRGGEWSSTNHEWMVPLEDETADLRALAEDALLPRDGWCYGRPVFVDDVATVICTPVPGERPGIRHVIRRIGTSGESAGAIALGNALADFYPTPVIDPGAKALFIWNPGKHEMSRVDLARGTTALATVPEGRLPGAGEPLGGAYIGADPSVVLSPDGSRLYAIGVRRGESEVGSASGIWVFDSTTLDLLDHWPAPAFFISLAVSADGRFVYAAGAPNYEPSGRPSGWPASITVFDAENGQVEVIHGQVARDAWLTLPQL